MSAHVLLNLLNELGKRDKMQVLPIILSFIQEHEWYDIRIIDYFEISFLP